MLLYAVWFIAHSEWASPVFANDVVQAKLLFRAASIDYGYDECEPVEIEILKNQKYFLQFSQSEVPHVAGNYFPCCKGCEEWGEVFVNGYCPKCHAEKEAKQKEEK